MLSSRSLENNILIKFNGKGLLIIDKLNVFNFISLEIHIIYKHLIWFYGKIVLF